MAEAEPEQRLKCAWSTKMFSLKIEASSFNFFFYKIYSLCKNNAISKVLNKLQVFEFEFKICSPNRHVSKILTKKMKCLNFEGDCKQNGSTGKVATWGVLIYSWNMTFSYKMQNSFLGIELISLKVYHSKGPIKEHILQYDIK